MFCISICMYACVCMHVCSCACGCIYRCAYACMESYVLHMYLFWSLMLTEIVINKQLLPMLWWLFCVCVSHYAPFPQALFAVCFVVWSNFFLLFTIWLSFKAIHYATMNHSNIESESFFVIIAGEVLWSVVQWPDVVKIATGGKFMSAIWALPLRSHYCWLVI